MHHVVIQFIGIIMFIQSGAAPIYEAYMPSNDAPQCSPAPAAHEAFILVNGLQDEAGWPGARPCATRKSKGKSGATATCVEYPLSGSEEIRLLNGGTGGATPPSNPVHMKQVDPAYTALPQAELRSRSQAYFVVGAGALKDKEAQGCEIQTALELDLGMSSLRIGNPNHHFDVRTSDPAPTIEVHNSPVDGHPGTNHSYLYYHLATEIPQQCKPITCNRPHLKSNVKTNNADCSNTWYP